jgi:hypothetical protein
MRSSKYVASPETYSRPAVLNRLSLKGLVNLHPEGSEPTQGADWPEWDDGPILSKMRDLIPGRIDDSGHYSGRIYKPGGVRQHAQWVVNHLDDLGEFDFVVASGKSGLSIAFAAQVLRDFPLVTIRKRDERSHGTLIEGNAHDMRRYIVIDDFISSGATMIRIADELSMWAESWDYIKPECLGYLLYGPERVSKYF